MPKDAQVVTNPQRAWVFTINNPADEESLPEIGAERYVIWQLEAGSEGTRHFQGYIEFTRAVRLSHFKSAGGDWARAHVEPRRGSREQAREYSSKEESRIAGPWERGSFGAGGQGTRTDVGAVCETARRTFSMRAVAEAHPAEFIRLHRGVSAYIDALDDRKRDWVTELHVLWGDPGSGKSRTAWAEAAAAGGGVFSIARSNSGNLWMDGYDGEANIIIDDFYGWIKWDALLRMADRYPLKVERKGGFVQFLARRIYITSNSHWTSWYRFDQHRAMDPGALHRRITSIRRGLAGVPEPELIDDSESDWRGLLELARNVREQEQEQ